MKGGHNDLNCSLSTEDDLLLSLGFSVGGGPGDPPVSGKSQT